MPRLTAAALVLPALLASTSAFAITVLSEAKSGPESITATPDGGVIMGSATSPRIFRAAKGETQAKLFIDAIADPGNREPLDKQGLVALRQAVATSSPSARRPCRRLHARRPICRPRASLRASRTAPWS